MIYLKTTDVKALREKLLEQQNSICPLCGRTISNDKAVLDHQHRQRKSDPIGVNGDGMVRGVLCNNCNQIEGKIANALKRFQGITQKSDKIDFLYNLIKYYTHYQTDYVHPSEKLPVQKISKRQYNKLVKVCKTKVPDYPKSGTLTKALKKLFEKYEISPFV